MAPERIGKYQVLGEIASGGQGAVYRAFDPSTGMTVAIKVLHAQYASNEAFVERFQREASLIQTIDHQNVVKIYDVGEADGLHFMALEYIPGSLGDLIEATGALSADRAVSLAIGISAGIGQAHAQGIVHRDIKPQNVLLTPDGIPKVTDFGIARDESLDTMTATGVMMGTPYYMSPEQADGQRADARSDVYSLGCLLYRLLSGEVPYTGDTPLVILRRHVEATPEPLKKKVRSVPNAVAKCVEKAMEKNPSKRYADANELVLALRKAMPDLVVQTPMPSQVTPVSVVRPKTPTPPPAKKPVPKPVASTSNRAQPTPSAPSGLVRVVSGLFGSLRSTLAVFGAIAANVIVFFIITNLGEDGAGSDPLVDGSNAPTTTAVVTPVGEDDVSDTPIPLPTVLVVDSGQTPIATVGPESTPISTATPIPTATPISITTPIPTAVTIPASDTLPESAGWESTASMLFAPHHPSATLLDDGKVLVVGSGTSAQIYNPSSGNFSLVGNTQCDRGASESTLLADGRVLLTGGDTDAKCVEIFDPSDGRFSRLPDTIAPHNGHTATLLNDGRVLIAGGWESNDKLLTSNRMEIFDPQSNTFDEIANLAFDRGNHAAVLLESGEVLIAGGLKQISPDQADSICLATAEIVDPLTGNSRVIDALTTEACDPEAVILPNGEILISPGGQEAQLFDPATEKFRRTGQLNSHHGPHTITSLDDGRVIVAGGYGPRGNTWPSIDTVEVYDSATGLFLVVENLIKDRQEHAAVLLQDGRVMVLGGREQREGSVRPLSSVEIFDPAVSLNPLATPAPDGLIAYWPGDGNAIDVVGGHDGRLLSGATFGSGVVGQAFDLPQAGAQIEILSGNDDFNFAPTQPITIEMWVKRTFPAGPLPPAVPMHLLGKRPVPDVPQFYQMAEHGGLGFGSDAGSIRAGENLLTFDQWKHLAVVFDGTYFLFYVDGVQTGEPARGTLPPANNAPLVIGSTGCCPLESFIGLMDEVKIYNRALAAAEIQVTYDAGIADMTPVVAVEAIPTPDGLVAWWAGDGDPDDIAGSNNGTLQNGATFAPGLVGLAFSLDGLDDYISLEGQPSIPGAMTVGAWIKLDGRSINNHNSIFNGDSISMLKLASAQDNLFEFSSPGGMVQSATPATSEWVHVVATWNGATASIFINGVLDASENAGESSSNGHPAQIGLGEPLGADLHPFGGLIDEVMVFDRALTTDEIQAIFDAGSAGLIKPTPTGTSTAPNITVTSPRDATDANPGDGICDDGRGSCTLRAAIMEANAFAGKDTITLPEGNYVLGISGENEDKAKTGDLDITSDLTINAAGADVTVIDGGGLDRVLHVVFPASLSMSGVTIKGGVITTSEHIGGGILNMGILSLESSTISGNAARGDDPRSQGGGIYNGGDLQVSDVEIVGNSAEIGGGIANYATATIIDSLIEANVLTSTDVTWGAGIANELGIVTISGTTIKDNRVVDYGGGISNSNAASLVIENSTFSGNSASNNGAAIWDQGKGTQVVLRSSTLLDNRAPGGSLWSGPAANVSVSNTIIFSNAFGDVCVGDDITSGGYNLSGDDSCNLTELTDLPNTDPLLGPLQDNGGPTFTHALLPDSPAIGTGDPDESTGVDQRGVDRDAPGGVSIGAYEFETVLVNWDFTKGTFGWAPWNSIGNFNVTSEGLEITVTGGDPFLGTDNLSGFGSTDLIIEIVMKSTADSVGGIQWISSTSAGTDFEVQTDGNWHTYEIQLPVPPSNFNFRLDPSVGPGAITLASIKVIPNPSQLTLVQPPPTYVTSIGTFGSDNGQFNMVKRVATDEQGNIFASSQNDNRILKFSSSGVFLSAWGSEGTNAGQFDGPLGIAVDSGGNVYVADSGNHRIQKFDNDGRFLLSWESRGQFTKPSGVAFAGSGLVFVSVVDNHDVQVFNTDGEFIDEWGGWGYESGRFSSPAGVAIGPNGEIYVADKLRHRIQKFTSDREFILEWGSYGAELGRFNQPVDVTVDSNGDVYVVDGQNSRIQKFSSEGEFLTSWGVLGNGDGQFTRPFGLTIDQSGRILVADTENSRIQVFQP